MKKLLQLLLGDLRNVASVAIALTVAYGAARWVPEAAGWILAAGLITATACRIA
jgi:hypothetical protein